MYGSAEAEEWGALAGLGHPPVPGGGTEVGTTTEALRKGHCSNTQGSGPGPGPGQLRGWERFKTTRAWQKPSADPAALTGASTNARIRKYYYSPLPPT